MEDADHTAIINLNVRVNHHMLEKDVKKSIHVRPLNVLMVSAY